MPRECRANAVDNSVAAAIISAVLEGVGRPRRAPNPAAGGSRVRHYCLWLVLLLLATTAVRAVHLEADPPSDLTDASLAEYTDEGLKTYHARNRVLFGAWIWHPRDQNTYWITHSPVSLWLHTGWFVLRGRVDVATARELHLLVGLLTLLLWAATVRREVGEREALASTAILGLGFLGVMFGRMVFLENLLAPVHAGLLWLLCRSRVRLHHLLLALALLLVGFFVKVTLLLFILAAGAGAALLVYRRHLQDAWPGEPAQRDWRLHRLVAGLAVLGLAGYAAFHALPGLAEAIVPLAARNPPVGPAGLLRNLTYIQFTTKHPFLFALAVIGAGGWILRSMDTSWIANRLLVVSSYWLVVGLLALAVFAGTADRPRYYLFLLPPMALLAARVVLDSFAPWPPRRHRASSASVDPAVASPRAGLGRRIFVGLLVALVVVHVAGGIYQQLTSESERLRLAALVADAVARGGLPAGPLAPTLVLPVVGAIIYLVLLGLAWWVDRQGGRRILVGLLALLAVATNTVQLGRWLVAPPWTMSQVRQDLVVRLPPDAVVAGQWAPVLGLGTPLRVLHLHYQVNLPGGRLAELAPTHLLLCDQRPEENDLLARDYAGLVRPEGLLAVYRIDEFTLRLYRVNWSGWKAGVGRDRGGEHRH